jgi:hypothetical protein
MSKVKFSQYISANVPDTESAGYRKPLRSLMQAAEADQQNHPLIRQALNMAKRFGVASVTNVDAMIDPIALDRELQASRATTEEKIRFKTLLAMLGVLR